MKYRFFLLIIFLFINQFAIAQIKKEKIELNKVSPIKVLELESKPFAIKIKASKIKYYRPQIPSSRPRYETEIPSSRRPDEAQILSYRNSVIEMEELKKYNIEDVKKEYENYIIDYYKHLTWEHSFIKEAYQFNRTQSVVIFILVICLVSVGILFAAIQFYISLKSVKLRSDISDIIEEKPKSNIPIIKNLLKEKVKKNDGATSVPSDGETSIKISYEGVEVKSSILGIVILALSLAFFYFYIIHVYPLNTVNDFEKPAQKEVSVQKNK